VPNLTRAADVRCECLAGLLDVRVKDEQLLDGRLVAGPWAGPSQVQPTELRWLLDTSAEGERLLCVDMPVQGWTPPEQEPEWKAAAARLERSGPAATDGHLSVAPRGWGAEVVGEPLLVLGRQRSISSQSLALKRLKLVSLARLEDAFAARPAGLVLSQLFKTDEFLFEADSETADFALVSYRQARATPDDGTTMDEQRPSRAPPHPPPSP